MFSIKVLGKNISDSDGNTTRFAIISAPKNAKEFSLKHKSGKPKTSIVFAVKNKPGSLFDAIKSFRDFGVNMTKIESRPSKKSAWEYVFFVDLDGLTGDSNVSAALKELGKHCNFVKVLGSFLMIE
jgi:chorismate mutase/prephenate dehydratase